MILQQLEGVSRKQSYHELIEERNKKNEGVPKEFILKKEDPSKR